MDWDRVADHLSSCLRDAEQELKRKRTPDDKDGVVEMLEATLRLEEAVTKHVPRPSIYIDECNDRPKDSIAARCQYAVALGKAFLSDITNGQLKRAEELIRADQFSSYLDMAEHLVSEGYKDPAAVLAGSSLEVHLRNLIAKSGLVPFGSNGVPKKASQSNDELANNGVYDRNVQKLVTSWLAIRNSAAHGKYEQVKKDDVELMIKWIRTFISEYPA